MGPIIFGRGGGLFSYFGGWVPREKREENGGGEVVVIDSGV